MKQILISKPARRSGIVQSITEAFSTDLSIVTSQDRHSHVGLEQTVHNARTNASSADDCELGECGHYRSEMVEVGW
jgi:hypothetical protein